MKFTAEQIAGVLGGEIVGNPKAEVYKLSKIEEGSEGSISFLANPKYLPYIYSTQATITIVSNSFIPEGELSTTLIKVDDANKRYNQLIENGIVIRNRNNQALCENCLRITIGTKEENEKLMAVLKSIKM